MTLADSLRARFDRESNREIEKVVYLARQPWAPEGYLHTIHKPLPTAALMRVANELEFPPSLIRHFHGLQRSQIVFREPELHLSHSMQLAKPRGLARPRDRPVGRTI